jgi:hypothetical protein
MTFVINGEVYTNLFQQGKWKGNLPGWKIHLVPDIYHWKKNVDSTADESRDCREEIPQPQHWAFFLGLFVCVRAQWRARVCTVMKFREPKKVKSFVSSWATNSFWRTLPYWVFYSYLSAHAHTEYSSIPTHWKILCIFKEILVTSKIGTWAHEETLRNGYQFTRSSHARTSYMVFYSLRSTQRGSVESSLAIPPLSMWSWCPMCDVVSETSYTNSTMTLLIAWEDVILYCCAPSSWKFQIIQ